MKIGSVSVSFLFCLDTAASKIPIGLRGLMQQHDAECLHHFDALDVDKDNVLSIQELEAVVDYLVDEKGVDENEVRTFAHDLSDADYNNDGQIDKQEFMIACKEKDHTEKKAKKAALNNSVRDQVKKMTLAHAQEKTEKKKYAQAQDDDLPASCYLPEDSGPCYAYFEKWYYNSDTGSCEEFVYGGCLGNNNNFDTKEACETTCMDTTCNLPADSGPCYAYFENWYYNSDTGSCEEFVYGGCLGNSNNFDTEEACETTCMDTTAKEAKMYKKTTLKECAGLFERMDMDKDGELSLQDLESVVDSKMKNNVDNSKLREFLDAMADLDVNNDEIIDNGEFMSACLKD